MIIEKELRKIFNQYNYHYIDVAFQHSTMKYLTQLYTRLSKEQRDPWEYYASSITTSYPAHTSEDTKRGPSLKNGNLTTRSMKFYGTGLSAFLRLNFFAINRYLTTEPLMEPPISCPVPQPPTNLHCKIEQDHIKVLWQDYTLNEKLYLAYKSVKLFYTLYYAIHGCDVNIRQYRMSSRVTTIISHPSNGEFTLHHLILKNNRLIELKNVENAHIYFQMDTCALIDNFAPVLSSLSNITPCQWQNSKTDTIAQLKNKLHNLIIKQQKRK